MKYLLLILLLIHGLIHIMGFVKAFRYAEIPQLTQEISKGMGWLWFLTTLIFFTVIFQFLLKQPYWWITALAGVFLSQYLIWSVWEDAKFGTVANIIILLVSLLSYTTQRFEKTFVADVTTHLQQNKLNNDEILQDSDIVHLPYPVQRYLRYSNVIGKPKVNNFYIAFEGQMREKGKDFFPFHSVQYNFMHEPTRLFFMKAKMFGITVPGYHKYEHGKAVMDIRLFGIFPVVHEEGPVMDKTETVTLFNDMCLMAPGSLIDKKIQWETLDSTRVKAVFTNHSHSISAELIFNQDGSLANFNSNDRTAISENKILPFLTPVHSYKEMEQRRVMSTGDAVWKYDDGEFIYGKFNLRDIRYNLASIIPEGKN